MSSFEKSNLENRYSVKVNGTAIRIAEEENSSSIRNGDDATGILRSYKTTEKQRPDNYSYNAERKSKSMTNEKVIASVHKINTSIGVVSILPKVQILLGKRLSSFTDALEKSRVPLALKKTLSNGKYETFQVLRLETGNIPEATIATLVTYNNIMVGLTYNGDIVEDKKFRKLVKLSAMHQLVLGTKEDPQRLYKATKYISVITKLPRESLIAIEKARSIRIRASSNNIMQLPIYYIFSLNKNGAYRLAEVSYDINDVIQRIDNK